VSLEN